MSTMSDCLQRVLRIHTAIVRVEDCRASKTAPAVPQQAPVEVDRTPASLRHRGDYLHASDVLQGHLAVLLAVEFEVQVLATRQELVETDLQFSSSQICIFVNLRYQVEKGR